MMPTHNPRDFGEIVRDEMLMRDKISACLSHGPKTVVDIAKELDYPSNEVMIWLMGMWRYGLVTETGKPDDEGYFHYKLREENGHE